MVKKSLRLLETKAFSFFEVNLMKAAVLEKPGKLAIRELDDRNQDRILGYAKI